MGRKITVINKAHPHNRMKASGRRATIAARAMSNEELAKFIEENIEDEEARAAVLALPRGRRIKYIGRCSEAQFAREFRAAQEAAQEEVYVPGETPCPKCGEPVAILEDPKTHCLACGWVEPEPCVICDSENHADGNCVKP